MTGKQKKAGQKKWEKARQGKRKKAGRENVTGKKTKKTYENGTLGGKDQKEEERRKKKEKNDS